jgi:hypothetical protein
VRGAALLASSTLVCCWRDAVGSSVPWVQALLCQRQHTCGSVHNHPDALHVLVCVASQLATGGPSRGLSLVSRVAPAASNVLTGARGSDVCDGF